MRKRRILSHSHTSGLHLRAVLLSFLAAMLMLADRHLPAIHQIRETLLAPIVLPIQLAVSLPIQWVTRLNANLSTRQRLLEENAALRAKTLLLQAKLQQLMTLEHENNQLKTLLKSTAHLPNPIRVAQLLAVALDPSVHEILLDQGAHNDIHRNQPVLDAYGVMGQVIDVSPTTSTALLLTDPRSAIPVKNLSNGFRAIAVGMGASQPLSLLYVREEDGINMGDQLVTSGLGRHFPVGYPVGVVSSIDKTPGERFLKVAVTPSAHLNQTEQVMLVMNPRSSD